MKRERRAISGDSRGGRLTRGGDGHRSRSRPGQRVTLHARQIHHRATKTNIARRRRRASARRRGNLSITTTIY